MKIKILRSLEELRSSFWFVSTTMALASIILVFLVEYADGLPGFNRLYLPWLHAIGADGARTVLATIASSSIGVASVVFSISVVTLSLTAGQFGPRLLKNFMDQGATQFTIGTFIATFIFSLLTLARIPGDQSAAQLPNLSVLFGLALGVLSFFVLIFFIHHIATFIQASSVINDVTRQLINRLENLPLRDETNSRQDNTGQANINDEPSAKIPSPRSGYLQAVDTGQLTTLASQHDLRIRIQFRPGHFVIKDQSIATVTQNNNIDQDLINAIQSSFVFGMERTPTQDIEFAIHQLVEIAVRALSPGINDPYTAVNCIDQLGAALTMLAERNLPESIYRDDQNKVRVVIPGYTYAGITDAAFNQIRQHGGKDAAVTIRLLDIINAMAGRKLPDSLCRELLRHARLIQDGKEQLSHPADREEVAERYKEIEAKLKR